MISFNVTYDPLGDVLYINKRQDPATRTVTDDFGIYWRYDASGQLIGATIIDFDDYWHSHMHTLETALSDRFNVPANQMKVILDQAKEK